MSKLPYTVGIRLPATRFCRPETPNAATASCTIEKINETRATKSTRVLTHVYVVTFRVNRR